MSLWLAIPTIAVPTFSPTYEIFPSEDDYRIFGTSGFFKGNQVRDSVCQAEATRLNFVHPERAFYFAFGFNKTHTLARDVLMTDLDGRFIAYVQDFLQGNLHGPLETFNTQIISEFWSGYEQANLVPGLSQYSCNNWTSNSSADTGYFGAETSATHFYYGWGRLICSNAAQILCLVQDAIPYITPPPIQPSDMDYRIFGTSDYFQGNQVRDSVCQAEATRIGFAHPERAFYFAAGFDELHPLNYSVLMTDLNGQLVAYVQDFVHGNLLGSLKSFNTQVNHAFWTGYYGPNFDRGNPEYTCNNWTSNSSDSGAYGLATAVTYFYSNHPLPAPCFINDEAQVLCLIQDAVPYITTPPTHSPTTRPSNAPTTSPTRSPSKSPTINGEYLLFMTRNSYYANQVSDLVCQTEAIQQNSFISDTGGGDPFTAFAFIPGNIMFRNLDLTKNIYGPNGRLITGVSDFLNDRELTTNSFGRASVCTKGDRYWSGFTSSFFDTNQPCTDWTSTSSGDTITIGLCTELDDPAQFFVLSDTCASEHPFLCMMKIYSPPPQPDYSMYNYTFFYQNEFGGLVTPTDVSDAACVSTAAQYGLPVPSEARAYLLGAPFLKKWDFTKSVVGIDGRFAANGSNWANGIFSHLPQLDQFGCIGFYGGFYYGGYYNTPFPRDPAKTLAQVTCMYYTSTQGTTYDDSACQIPDQFENIYFGEFISGGVTCSAQGDFIPCMYQGPSVVTQAPTTHVPTVPPTPTPTSSPTKSPTQGVYGAGPFILYDSGQSFNAYQAKKHGMTVCAQSPNNPGGCTRTFPYLFGNASFDAHLLDPNVLQPLTGESDLYRVVSDDILYNIDGCFPTETTPPPSSFMCSATFAYAKYASQAITASSYTITCNYDAKELVCVCDRTP